MIGPVKGQRGHWLAVGIMAGLSQGGGVGKTLANWITDGDPGADVWGMDCARFGDFATPAYTNAKVRENYSRRFRIAYPNEELPAARKIRTIADPRSARRGERGVGRVVRVGARALVPARRARPPRRR